MSSQHRKVQVRILHTRAEIHEALSLRYRVYFEELHRDQKYANQEAKILRDALDDRSIHAGAFCPVSGQMIGTCRMSFWQDGELPENELYRFSDFAKEAHNKISFTSKMVVLPAYRGSTAFVQLATILFEEALKRGCRYDIIATADHLVPTFKRLGYKAHRPRTTWADYGSSNPMVFDLWDFDHMREVRSPFYGIAERAHQFRSGQMVAA